MATKAPFMKTLGILVSLKKGFEGRKRGGSEVKRRALCVFC